MPEYLSPGVYVEEIEISGKSIEGVSTSTAGFVGETERGPTEPQLITSFGEYQRVYGGHAWTTDNGDSDSFLPYGVEGFFLNGGKRCYVARIIGQNSASASLGLQIGETKVTASAVDDGTWGNRIAVVTRDASSALLDKTLFKLDVYYWDQAEDPKKLVDPADRAKVKTANQDPPTVHEQFDNLSWDPGSRDYYLRRINGISQLIELAEGDAAGSSTTTSTTATTTTTTTTTTSPNPVKKTFPVLQGGKDGKAPVLADYVGDSAAQPGEKTGLAALAEIDDISIVCVPDEPTVDGLSDAVVEHCENLKDRFAILQSKQKPDDVGQLRPPVFSKYAAFYYPWLEIIDPVSNLPKLVPPGGHVAGIYARSDTNRGVHKAPANEPVRGIVDLQFNVTTGDQDVLNPRGVNCIRSFVGRGNLVWGARTTSDDPAWKYVNVRRLFLFLEKSIQRSTQWVVFEPNNQALWARLKQGVSDWLVGVWRDGALMGTTPEQAFFVRCDETTMTENDIENGKLIMIIGVAPTRPAEFVIFQLAQWRSGSAIIE
jgi:uncharacterized protein